MARALAPPPLTQHAGSHPGRKRRGMVMRVLASHGALNRRIRHMIRARHPTQLEVRICAGDRVAALGSQVTQPAKSKRLGTTGEPPQKREAHCGARAVARPVEPTVGRCLRLPLRLNQRPTPGRVGPRRGPAPPVDGLVAGAQWRGRGQSPGPPGLRSRNNKGAWDCEKAPTDPL
jgi:hypothetical protein